MLNENKRRLEWTSDSIYEHEVQNASEKELPSVYDEEASTETRGLGKLDSALSASDE